MAEQPRNRNTRNAAANRQRQQAAAQARKNAAVRQTMVIDPSQASYQQAPPAAPSQQYQQQDQYQDAYPEAVPEKQKKPKVSILDRLKTGRSASEILDDSLDWIYDHSTVIFAVYGIIFLVLGVLLNRYISFGAGLVLVLLGYMMSARDDAKDTFLFYIVGLVIFAIPFMIN